MAVADEKRQIADASISEACAPSVGLVPHTATVTGTPRKYAGAWDAEAVARLRDAELIDIPAGDEVAVIVGPEPRFGLEPEDQKESIIDES